VITVAKTLLFLSVFSGACLNVWGQASPGPLGLIEAERSRFELTGDYAEVASYCQSAAQNYPASVRCFSIGHSAEGRPIWAMAISQSGILTPAQARQSGIPVVLAIAGTHAGEIDGKDAGLLLIRELLAQPSNKLLRDQIFLFVPVFNVDGHEKTSPHNRPNQRGPRVQGDRVTAQRINLNRDWILGQSAEMNAMLAFVSQWDPLLTLDLHVTDGVRFRHEVSLSMSPMFGADQALQETSEQFLAGMIKRLDAKSHHPLDFTPALLDFENPRAGIMREVDSPRFSHVYPVLRNRLGVLVEDHAWTPYPKRVQVCKDVLIAALELTAENGRNYLKVMSRADEAAVNMSGNVVALDWNNLLEMNIDIPTGFTNLLGYEYTTHEDAPVIGGRNITYHTNRPEIWRTPVYRDIHPVNEAIVALPRAGYLIPAGWVSVVKPYLEKHDITFHTLRRNFKNLPVQALQVESESISYETGTFQGRLRTVVRGTWMRSQADVLAGSIFVPIHQVHGLLAAHLLEPSAPDSLSSWGLFNAAYEVTDYISNHRQLQLAQRMYQEDPRILKRFGEALYKKLPELKKQYQIRMDRDERFRNDPEQRVDFWMRQIPHYDPTFNQYPIVRVEQSPLILTQ